MKYYTFALNLSLNSMRWNKIQIIKMLGETLFRSLDEFMMLALWNDILQRINGAIWLFYTRATTSSGERKIAFKIESKRSPKKAVLQYEINFEWQ